MVLPGGLRAAGRRVRFVGSEQRTPILAGTYEYKVAYGLSFTENSGAGGVLNGANLSVIVPANSGVTFTYVKSTHLVTAIVSPA